MREGSGLVGLDLETAASVPDIRVACNGLAVITNSFPEDGSTVERVGRAVNKKEIKIANRRLQARYGRRKCFAGSRLSEL
jgi:hypothetical protein